MNLLTRRVKYIKSYERECAMVIASIRAHELTDYEAHIGFEVKMLRRLARGCMRAHPAHGCPAYEAVEVGDRGRFGARRW